MSYGRDRTPAQAFPCGRSMGQEVTISAGKLALWLGPRPRSDSPRKGTAQSASSLLVTSNHLPTPKHTSGWDRKRKQTGTPKNWASAARWSLEGNRSAVSHELSVDTDTPMSGATCFRSSP